MPDLLVTLCNLAVPRDTALLRVDTDSGEVTPVKLGATVSVKSCTGLTIDDTRIYVLCADVEVRSYLAVLNRADLAPIYFQFLPDIIDGHSMLIHQGHLFITSTGNDALITYDLFEDRVGNPVLLWSIPDHSGTHHDTHHLNSVALWNGDIVFSAFGAKNGRTWSSAVEGYLYNLTQGTMLAAGIYHPHSLKVWGGKLYYCESARGRIVGLDGSSWEIDAYARGLAFIGTGIAAVGSSVARKISKSTGFINNPDDPGEQAGSCEVNLFRLSSELRPEPLSRISLAEYGAEIYDLQSLEVINGAKQSGQAANGRRIRSESMSENSGDQVYPKLLEQHQLLSELNRAEEIREQKFQQLAQLLKKNQDECSEYQAKIAQQGTELASLGQQLASIELELASKNRESARLQQEIQQLNETRKTRSAFSFFRNQMPIGWIARFFRKQR